MRYPSIAAPVAVALLLALAPAASAEPTPREELAPAPSGAGDRVLRFVQMSDTHVIDEESPLRVEFTDKFGSIFTSAFRPQEGISPQVLHQMVLRLRAEEDLDLAITTGDNTDSGQCNETRWMIDAMSGNGDIDPDSGTTRTEFSRDQLCLPRGAEAKGANGPVSTPVPAGCDPAREGRTYEGVRGGEYYEPDDDSEGPAYRGLKNFPGLFEDMQAEFTSTGLDIPWYSVFGNHDGLIQGNQPRNPGFEAIGVGCLKVTALSNAEAQSIRNAPDEPTAMARAVRAMRSADPTDPGVEVILPDPRRRPLKKEEWIAEHLRDDPHTGHGFGLREESTPADMGYYAFSPEGREDLLFVSLDSISEHGLEEGNIDDAQFRWLHEKLLEAELKKQRVLVFAHHSLRTMGQPPISPFLPGDAGGTLDPNVHFGEGPRNSGIKLPCAVTDPSIPPLPAETLRCLLLRHPSVVAFVNGHEHANRIDPVVYASQDGPAAPRAGRGFWEINTASHIDWPQETRILEINDHGDTLTIETEMVTHSADDAPGDASSTHPEPLARISRYLSANEPQTGKPASAGGPGDRDAVLAIRDPAGS